MTSLSTPSVHAMNTTKKNQKSDSSLDFLSRYQVQLPQAILDLALSESAELSGPFEPGDYDVICGRGKGCYNRPGNKRFRDLVRTFVPEYMSTKTKFAKSLLLNKIIDHVHEQNNGTARFVKKDRKTGRWVEISDQLKREKVGHAIREAMAENSAVKRKVLGKSVTKKEAVVQPSLEQLYYFEDSSEFPIATLVCSA